MTDVLREIVLPKLQGVRKQGGYWMARCPAHEDERASMQIAPGKEHPVVLKCMAGCQTADILAAVDLTWEMLCAPREASQAIRAWTPWGDAVAVYDYIDENGVQLFQVLRGPGKNFIQRRPDATAKSGWKYQLGDTRRVLYRLPRIIQAVAGGEIIYITEGEKDVHALEAAGVVATCNPQGAGKWKGEFSEFLRDAIVLIIADRDDPGYEHARMVAASLKGIAAAVEIREAAQGKDAADHLAAGLAVRDFVTIWQDSDGPQNLAPDLLDFVAVEDPPQVFVLGNMLELGEIMMLTGPEGWGKSTLLRQIGVCAAAGLHPFNMADITPRRVLMIDCENQERQSRREFRPLVGRAKECNHELAPGMFRLIVRPQGMDLGSDDGQAWLLERVTAHEPELLLLGSLWRLHRGDLNDELNARVVTEAINTARNKAGCAVIIEAHSPHGEGRVWRNPRPAGSSLFLRWPDAGIGLMPERTDQGASTGRYHLERWRGLRDRRQPWPEWLVGGIPGGWPWIAAVEDENDGGVK